MKTIQEPKRLSRKTGPKEAWKWDNLVIKKLEESFAIGASIGEACFYANISHQTYYNHVKDGEELFERFNALREKPVLKARQTVANDLGNVETAKWYLERKRKGEFSQQNNNLNLNVQLPTPIYGGKSVQVQGHDSNQEDIQSGKEDQGN